MTKIRPTKSIDRVREYLEITGLAAGLVESDISTKTAAEAAEVAGCELGQIVKTLVVKVDDEPVLALVAGDRRADFDAIAQAMGGHQVKMADAETVRQVTGYAIGGVCPFCLPSALPILLDDSLQRFEIVYPAAGTPRSFVRMTLHQLTTIVGTHWSPIGC